MAQTSAGSCRLETKYDSESNTSSVSCHLLERVTDFGRLMVHANVSFQGKQANESTRFWLRLSSFISSATGHTNPILSVAGILSLRLDESRLDIPITGYHQDYYEMSRMLVEQAQGEINRQYLQKLLGAKRIAGCWGSGDFELTDAETVTLRDFISRLVLAVPSKH